MRTLIIYHSGEHKNTEKVAQVMARALQADLRKVSEAQPQGISEYELIGFGAGIYFAKHHGTLLKFAEQLPDSDKKVFIFSTSGMGGTRFHKALKNKLSAKGYQVIAEFACKGFDTFGPFKFLGGLNKGRPNARDLEKAANFAQSLADNREDADD